MAVRRWPVVFISVLLLSGSLKTAEAQTAEGPLSPPSTVVVPAPRSLPKTHTTRQARTAHAKPAADKKAGPLEPWAAIDPDRVARPAEAAPSAGPAPVMVDRSPNDAVDLGMKWNGTNDTAAQTRVQNYGGDAAGTGAAVGMRLHF